MEKEKLKEQLKKDGYPEDLIQESLDNLSAEQIIGALNLGKVTRVSIAKDRRDILKSCYDDVILNTRYSSFKPETREWLISILQAEHSRYDKEVLQLEY